jgi:putative membrane protein
MTFADLPAVNATLNGTSAVLLGCGYYFVKRDRLIAHRNCMIAAFTTSVLFLICYLTFHLTVKKLTRFENPQWFRPIYLAILLTHTVLAAVIVPLILMTLSRALKQRFDLHKKIARWTWPLWMYVSVTGVLIYWLLYIRFPQK